jgi:hypothetical protein
MKNFKIVLILITIIVFFFLIFFLSKYEVNFLKIIGLENKVLELNNETKSENNNEKNNTPVEDLNILNGLADDLFLSILITKKNNGFVITYNDTLLPKERYKINLKIRNLNEPQFLKNNYVIKKNVKSNTYFDFPNQKHNFSFNINFITTFNYEKNTTALVENKVIKKEIRVITIGNNNNKVYKTISFEPEKSAILLLDFFPNFDWFHPSVEVIRQSRLLGIPVYHYMHEFRTREGMGMMEVLKPVSINDFIIKPDNEMVRFHFGNLRLNRPNIDTIFVMGYDASVCAMFTRHNSINYLMDLYPDLNIIPIEEGIDKRKPQDKWAISNYRSFTKTVSVIDLLHSWGVEKRITNKIINKYINKEDNKGLNTINHDMLNGDHLLTAKLDKEDIFLNFNNHLFVEVESDNLEKKIIKNIELIKEEFKNKNLPILKITKENIILLNDKIIEFIYLKEFIETKKLIPVISGHLRNTTPIWRIGFPGDFSWISKHPKIRHDVIFVKDALQTTPLPPFSDFNFDSKDSIQILINRASLYSDTGWSETKSIIDNFRKN